MSIFQLQWQQKVGSDIFVLFHDLTRASHQELRIWNPTQPYTGPLPGAAAKRQAEKEDVVSPSGASTFARFQVREFYEPSRGSPIAGTPSCVHLRRWPVFSLLRLPDPEV